MKDEFSPQIFEKSSDTLRYVADGQADRQSKLIVPFCNFANAVKNTKMCFFPHMKGGKRVFGCLSARYQIPESPALALSVTFTEDISNLAMWPEGKRMLYEYRAMVPEVCSADSKRTATNSQGIRGYISVMTTLKLSKFLIKSMTFC